MEPNKIQRTFWIEKEEYIKFLKDSIDLNTNVNARIEEFIKEENKVKKRGAKK